MQEFQPWILVANEELKTEKKNKNQTHKHENDLQYP